MEMQGGTIYSTKDFLHAKTTAYVGSNEPGEDAGDPVNYQVLFAYTSILY